MAPVLWRYGIQWTRELVGLASGVRQEGVIPETLGSSGTLDKYWSKCSLNSHILMLVRFRICFGRTLKSLGAAHWKLESLSVLTLVGPLSFLTLNVRPFLVFASFCISTPQFGAMFSNIFQM